MTLGFRFVLVGSFGIGILASGCARTPSSEASPPSSAPPASTHAEAVSLVATSTSHPASSASTLPAASASAPAAASTPFASACRKIALTIALDRSAPQQGLSLDAKLRNDGSSAAALMTTGDGSSYDRRNPSVSFALTPNDVGNEDRCGMINAMEDADFVTLKPGESRKLDWIRPPQPGKPGRYTLRATYRNDPSAKPMRGGEPHPPTASQMEKLSRTVPCEVTSNALTFEWNGNSAKPAP